MRKTVVSILLIVFLTPGLLVSCGGVLVGSGNLETEEYDFNDFDKVEISTAFEFEISQSGSYSISITADDNVLEKVQVTKEGNTLKIGLKTFTSLGHVTLKADIAMPQLHGLDISGASHGIISGFSSTEDIYLIVSGASKVTGDITSGDVDFDVSGASTVELEGFANNIIADVSGASGLNLGGFIVNDADVSFSGMSTGTINLSGRLEAELSGASKLTYIGEPTMGNINTSGLSTISKK